jgi:hypothetical protein
MMNNLAQTMYRFIKVMASGQTYLNILYLLAAFPLSVFYFVFLVSGLSLGISLSIIWIGIPLLLVVGSGWWILASFERFMAIHLLKEDVTTATLPPRAGKNIWSFLKEYLANPITWKSPIYLLLKFPLGIATFAILVTLVSLTLAFLTLPLTFQLLDFQISGFFSPDHVSWQIDSIGKAFLGTLIGLILLPFTMHLINGMAWVHAKFARVMLSATS